MCSSKYIIVLDSILLLYTIDPIIRYILIILHIFRCSSFLKNMGKSLLIVGAFPMPRVKFFLSD